MLGRELLEEVNGKNSELLERHVLGLREVFKHEGLHELLVNIISEHRLLDLGLNATKNGAH